MFLLIGLAFAFVLANFIGGPSNVVDNDRGFDNVVPGQTALLRVDGRRVWVTRMSVLLRQQMQKVDKYVLDSEAGCSLALDLCLLRVETARSGIEIVYSVNRPSQLSNDVAWYGGFVDPTSGEVFDRLGRSYLRNRAPSSTTTFNTTTRNSLEQLSQ